MTRDGGSRPYPFVPCDLVTSHEPFIATINPVFALTLKIPVARSGAAVFEEFFHGAYLFPCPAAVEGGRIVRPVRVPQVMAMHPFNPQRFFFICNGPNELGYRGFVPTRKVFNTNASILLGFAGGSP